ncbi:hypothetical protein Tco_0993137 [Tanacetum coccineum]|uniref:Uncharacterized protein n=1 Tax=Tanacetum coccineum TaxID=301880 RepID=A0ABQ5F4S5_9ASTR
MSSKAQQIELDNALVAPKNLRVIGKCNMRINPGMKPKEPTYQVVLDALALTTYILNICLRIHGQEFDEPPIKEEALSFICELGHSGKSSTSLMLLLIVGIKSLLEVTAVKVCVTVAKQIKEVGGRSATKKTQRNLLKQQYENFTAPSSETLNQTFDRLQKLMSQLEILGETLSQEDVNQKLLRSLSLEWNIHAVMCTNEAVNTAHRVSAVSTQVSAANSTNVDNLSDTEICAFFSSQPNNPQHANKDLQQLHPDDLEEMDLRWQMAMLTMRAIRWSATTTTREDTLLGSAELQETKTTGTGKAIEGVYQWLTTTSNALVSCDGIGYDWSDQAEEGPTNYALMAYSSLSSDYEVSNDSTCSKYCLETVEVLKSQYDQLLKRFEKSELMVRVNIVKDKNVNAARPKAVVNAARPEAIVNPVKGNNVNVVKASACWIQVSDGLGTKASDDAVDLAYDFSRGDEEDGAEAD